MDLPEQTPRRGRGSTRIVAGLVTTGVAVGVVWAADAHQSTAATTATTGTSSTSSSSDGNGSGSTGSSGSQSFPQLGSGSGPVAGSGGS